MITSSNPKDPTRTSNLRLMRVLRRLLSYDSRNKEIRRIFHRLVALRCSFLWNNILLSGKVAWIHLWCRGRRVVLISQVVHMGDIVACEPVIRHIRQEEKNAFIVLAVERCYRELGDSHPEVDYTLPLYCYTEWIRFAEKWEFDRIIDLNIKERTCPLCGIRGEARDGYHGITFDNYYHDNNLLGAYSRSAGLPLLSDSPKLHIDANVRNVIDRLGLPQRFVVIHAGANEARRALPKCSWLEIKQFLASKFGLLVVEIGLVALLGQSDTGPYRSLCGQLSILESSEVIRRSLMYIGTDSGPAHLANAVGAYGIIGLGRYHLFERYTPYSGNYYEGRDCELVRYDGPVNEMPVEPMLGRNFPANGSIGPRPGNLGPTRF